MRTRIVRLKVELTIFLVFATGIGSHIPPPRRALAGDPTVTPALSSPRKVALIVGLNYYPNLSADEQLTGPVNDAILLGRILQTPKFGFRAEDIHLVLSPRLGEKLPRINAQVSVLPGKVTKRVIVETLRKYLVEEVRPGDILFLAYSGHGSLWFDRQSPSRLARTLVPTDSRELTGSGTDILTVELANLVSEVLARNPGNLTIVLDSCYSGSRIRGRFAASVPRGIPPDHRQTVVPQYRDAFKRSQPRAGQQVPVSIPSADRSFFTINRKYVLMAAAREDQLAWEDSLEPGAPVQGIFTHYLVDALRSSTTTTQTTYRELFERVATRVRTRTDASQIPVLEGERDAILFGGQVRDQRPYLVVGERSDRFDPNIITLPAGRVAGVTAGSVYDIYPKDDLTFADPRNKLGTAVIKQINLDKSFATITAGTAPEGAHAVERIHAQSSTLRVKLLAKSLPKRLKAAILKQIRASPFSVTVGEGSAYDVAIAEDPDHRGRLRAELASGEPLGGSFDIADPQTPLKLAANVAKYGRVRVVAAIENPASHVRFSATWVPSGGAPTPPLRSGYPVLRAFSETEGDVIAFTIMNKAPNPQACPLWAAIINIALDGKILVVPEHSDTGARIPWVGVRFKMVIPQGMLGFRRGQEIFKIVVATRPINVRSLEQTGYLRSVPFPASRAAWVGGCEEDWATKDFIFWVDSAKR